MGSGLDLTPMARGEKPRKIDSHWVLEVIAENLAEKMKKDGRSARQLGKDAKVGRKSVERLRAGENSTIITLGAVADQLGVSPAELMMVRKRTPLVSLKAAEDEAAYSIDSAKRNAKKK